MIVQNHTQKTIVLTGKATRAALPHANLYPGANLVAASDFAQFDDCFAPYVNAGAVTTTSNDDDAADIAMIKAGYSLPTLSAWLEGNHQPAVVAALQAQLQTVRDHKEKVGH